jgi:putative oxidoreductase
MAERFAFGTPMTEDEAEPHISVVPRSTTMLVARILMAAIFLTSGFAKLTDPAGAIGHMTASGIPAADVLVYVAGIAEILGGLSLVFGFFARLGALGLVVLLAIINVTMHAFWLVEGQERLMQTVQFVKNLAVMGGLLLLYAVGPGRFSIDWKMRKPMQP